MVRNGVRPADVGRKIATDPEEPGTHGRSCRNGDSSASGVRFRNGRHVGRLLLAFYGGLILAGTLALTLSSSLTDLPLPLQDALFMAVSAATLTGLETVPASDLAPLGKWIVLLLVQAGGIGVLFFASRLLLVPGHSFSHENHIAVPERWSDVNELSPPRLLRNIIAVVLLVEAAGALVLYGLLPADGMADPAFTAIFHSVSALCNAGFSTYAAGEAGILLTEAPVAATIGVLVLFGGIGYVVLDEVVLRVAGRRKSWSLNVPIAIFGTVAVIAGGTVLYLLVDGGASAGFGTAVLRTVNARTAGFAFVDPARTSSVSQIISMLLMFVGGAAGSVTGGIKITAALVLLLSAWKGFGSERCPVILRHRITDAACIRTIMFVLRAVMMLAAALFLIVVAEARNNPAADIAFGDLVFETVSAFTTAGLSTGITPMLSAAGKSVLIITMLLGRIGLLLLVARMGTRTASVRVRVARPIYPEGEVLLG